MRELLQKHLFFRQAWLDSVDSRPNSEVGYIRADHDGWRWWNTVWPIHKELETPELLAEFDAVYNAFTQEFANLNEVGRFCQKSAEAVGTDRGVEYNAYLMGEYGFYWLRMNTRKKEYNLYLHCYSRAMLEGLCEEFEIEDESIGIPVFYAAAES